MVTRQNSEHVSFAGTLSDGREDEVIEFEAVDTVNSMVSDDYSPGGARQVTQSRRMGMSSASLAEFGNRSKPNFAKSDKERQDVLDLIAGSHDSKVQIMMGTVKPNTLEEIVDAMFKRAVKDGEVLAEEGADTGCIFIVQSGSFDILERPRPEPGQDPAGAATPELVKVFEATAGYSMGEHIGQSMQQSACQVVAREDSEVWCLDMDTFRMLVLSSAEEQFRAHCGFLKGCDILSDLRDDQIAALAEVIMEEDFADQEAIVEQDDRDTNMFILREGQAVAAITGEHGAVEVAKYGPGDYFGEIALLLGKARQATVYAVGKAVCLYINRESFNRLLGPLGDILRGNIEKYHKYQEFLEEHPATGCDSVRTPASSITPLASDGSHLREVFDGTWDKYKLGGRQFRKTVKVAKTVPQLPDIASEHDLEALASAEAEAQATEAMEVVASEVSEMVKAMSLEEEPVTLQGKVAADFKRAALVKPDARFALESCAIHAFGEIRPGEKFTKDKVLVAKTGMTPQADGFEDHYAWHAPTWTKGSTHIAALCQKGHKADDDPTPNQDNYFIFHVGMVQVYGVADGHGPFGHLVSFRLVQTLPHFLASSKHFGKDWQEALREAFLSAQSDLLSFAKEHNVNVEASGAAGTILVFEGPSVHVAHIGDAGAMVASWNRRDSRLIMGTEDHKPQLPEERRRLEAAGSEVREVDEDSFRIYRAGSTFPGLTMSRAFGDTACDGVVQEPEYQKLLLQPSDEVYAVIASDGIWEFLNYDKVVELSAKKLRLKGPGETARFLVEASRKRWKIAAGDYCDDITILVVQWNVFAQEDSNFHLTLKRHEEEEEAEEA